MRVMPGILSQAQADVRYLPIVAAIFRVPSALGFPLAYLIFSPTSATNRWNLPWGSLAMAAWASGTHA